MEAWSSMYPLAKIGLKSLSYIDPFLHLSVLNTSRLLAQ